MRNPRKIAIDILLVIAILSIVAFNLYEFRRLFHDFDTVEIQTAAIETEQQGSLHKLDAILYDNISHFQRIRSFDHLFTQRPKRYSMSTLWVDQCEVRQGDFYKFVKWNKQHMKPRIAAKGQPSAWQYRSASENHKLSGRLKAPANGVSYYDAHAYCKAADGRLPTRSEWLALANGQQQNLYPWGDEYVADAWPYLDTRLNAAQACGLHPTNRTPTQIDNLGDTVSEWASGDSGDSRPSIHGGNAYNRPFAIYSLSNFYRFAPEKYRSPYVGFRCVYDSQPVAPGWRSEPPKVVRISPATYRLGIPEGANLPRFLIDLSHKKAQAIKEIFEYQQQGHTFSILNHEVTRAEYRDFLNDPLVQLGIYANEKQPKDHSYEPAGWQAAASENRDDLPVTGIDWWSAWAFANWAGGRLPSAAEWTIAASQNGERLYPWGDRFDIHAAVVAEGGFLKAQSAQSNRDDRTDNAIYDLGGNVSEWTRSIVALSNHYVAVVKGGNYSLPGEKTSRADFENQAPLSLRSPRIGFRIVFD